MPGENWTRCPNCGQMSYTSNYCNHCMYEIQGSSHSAYSETPTAQTSSKSCSECGGSGWVSAGPPTTQADRDRAISGVRRQKKCPVCNGKGSFGSGCLGVVALAVSGLIGAVLFIAG